jgi:glycosyltransferase involved in cell wall biosynthesis
MNFFLRFVKSNRRLLIVTPLNFQSLVLQNKYGLPNVLAVGNAAPAEYFVAAKEDSGETTIGYIGKLESSGFSNNITSLLHLAQLVDTKKMKIQVELVGISSIEIEKLLLESGIKSPPPNLKVVEHVPHEQIYGHLSTFSIGVVPYPQSDYHNQRFPIKIVEYAAAGVPIIICNPFYLDSVIPSEFVYFAEPTGESILESVMRIVNSPSEAAGKSKLARDWSQNLTYLKRTENILNSIGVGLG